MTNQKVTLTSFKVEQHTWGSKKGKYKIEIELKVNGGHTLNYQLPEEVGNKVIALVGAELYQASVDVSNTITTVFENIIGEKGVTYEQLEVLEEHKEMGAQL